MPGTDHNRDIAAQLEDVLNTFLELSRRHEDLINRHSDRDERFFEETRREHARLHEKIETLGRELRRELAESVKELGNEIGPLQVSTAVLYLRTTIAGAIAGGLSSLGAWTYFGHGLGQVLKP